MNQNPSSLGFNKIQKSIAKWIEVKRERPQKCKKLIWEKTTDKEEHLKVVGKYFLHLYENNFEKLDEMDNFLGKSVYENYLQDRK